MQIGQAIETRSLSLKGYYANGFAWRIACNGNIALQQHNTEEERERAGKSAEEKRESWVGKVT